jgi:hypothetical protein
LSVWLKLQRKGVLTEAEFTAKTTELLARLRHTE